VCGRGARQDFPPKSQYRELMPYSPALAVVVNKVWEQTHVGVSAGGRMGVLGLARRHGSHGRGHARVPTCA
jgi:hypothetical protein